MELLVVLFKYFSYVMGGLALYILAGMAVLTVRDWLLSHRSPK